MFTWLRDNFLCSFVRLNYTLVVHNHIYLDKWTATQREKNITGNEAWVDNKERKEHAKKRMK